MEDDARVRQTSIQRLEQLGYNIIAAEYGQTALEFIANEAAIDLLFTDIVMPGSMNGRELAAKAKQVKPEIKVLFTSGYADLPNDGNDAFTECDYLIRKPYKTAELSPKIQQMLDARVL